VPGSEYRCLNLFGGANGPLRYWQDEKSLTDEGSTFRVMEAPDPDGIEEIMSDELRMMNEGGIYDLSGRQVNVQSSMFNGQLRKGIYIINGKKVLVK